MRMVTLNSSNVAGISYNADEEELFASFSNGQVYKYSGVPGDVVLSILFEPESQGKAFNAKVKNGNYPYHKVDDPEALDIHV